MVAPAVKRKPKYLRHDGGPLRSWLLKTQGLIEPGLQPQMVRNIHVGRMITMGTLLRYLDGADIGRL